MGDIVTDKKVIEELLRDSLYLRLGLCDEGKPYIVPMTFGYEDRVIYLHSSKKGKKIDILNKNKNVCFEVDKMYEMLPSKNPCSYDMKYQSVVGFGKTKILEDETEKKAGLKVIIDRYHNEEYNSDKMNVKGLAVIRIDIEEMQGRENNMK